jgi:hypothetical protein
MGEQAVWEGRILPANTGEFHPGQADEEDHSRRRRERRIWWGWVLGTTATWAALTGIVTLLGKYVPAVRGQDEGWEYLLYLAGGIIQACVLRGHLRGAQWWAAVTAAAAALAVGLHVLFFAGPVPLLAGMARPQRDAVTTAIDFGLIALAQWLWLRARVWRARWWLIATLIPAALLALLSLGAAAGEEAAAEDDGWLLVVSASVVALLVAWPTASAIIRLLRKPVQPVAEPAPSAGEVSSGPRLASG